ncbi:MAG: hypothetical protein WC157_01780 [Candidatus Paceibacterota bacterium]
MKNKEKQKGSLYLTVIMIGILIAIAIGVIGIIVSGASLVKGLGDSVRAFHVADSGVEQILYKVRKEESNSGTINGCSTDFQGYGTVECNATWNASELKSTGLYNGSQRRIEAEY